MVKSRQKGQLRRFKRVVRREMDIQKENPAGVGTIVRAHDCGLPVEHILFVLGPCAALKFKKLIDFLQKKNVCGWVLFQVLEFLMQ